ncbi:MAG: hypothetical protein AB7P14_29820 [Blastocatellales bacterium]
MRLSIKSMIVILTMVLAIYLPEHGRAKQIIQEGKPKFKYLIFRNALDEKKEVQHIRRTLGIFLEEKAFSEQNLKELYSLLSKRFPEPSWLEIWVYTDLNQVETPEEADTPKSSNTPDNLEIDRFYWAWIYSNKGNTFFRYNINPPNKQIKTVIIAGKDPF